MENAIGLGVSGRGEERTSSIARLRCFFPIYPLGHNVSDISSTGMTNGVVGTVVVEFDLMECKDFEDDDDNMLRFNRLLEQRNAVDEARLKPKAAALSA